MATESRRTPPPVSDQLTEEPWKFEFFQAVKLIEQCGAEAILSGRGTTFVTVGQGETPTKEMVRFRALASHTFPTGEIASITCSTDADQHADAGTHFEMTVPFFGLTGPNGVLPQHYTQLVIDRIRVRDYALRDFLDIFNHRMLSLFYRAWEKYRFPICYEKKSWQVRIEQSHGPIRDDSRIALFERCLHALVGMRTEGIRGRLDVSDEVFLYYAGLFAQRPRNAVSLARMLEDYLDLPVAVGQFQGQWLYLNPADQTSLPSPTALDGRNAALGTDTIIGERVWSVQDKFRMRIGPLDYASFCRFMPTGDHLHPIAQLTRTYVGPEFDFDVQPVLRAGEVPPLQLETDTERPPCLGWNTWLLSRPTERDCDDAVFTADGNPRSDGYQSSNL